MPMRLGASVVVPVVPVPMAMAMIAVMVPVLIPMMAVTVPPLMPLSPLLVVLMMPFAVSAFRNLHQGHWHAAGFHKGEGYAGRARAVPATRTAAPIPATVEEDLIVEALYHLDAGPDLDERRGNGETNIDVEGDLGGGSGIESEWKEESGEELRHGASESD